MRCAPIGRALAGALCVASCARVSADQRRRPSPPDTVQVVRGPPAGLAEAGLASGPAPRSGPAAPLSASAPIIPLPVPGFEDAVISIPLGATGRRPVVIAAHGLWDPPEGLCDNWRWIIRDRAWVLCPRGERRPDGTFRYATREALASEIEAGARALAARYPDYVDTGPMLFTGFSRGALLGVSVIARDPARFPRAVLVEGGEDGWTEPMARTYAAGGGARVLMACGLRSRFTPAAAAAKKLERAGVPSRVVLGKLPDAGEFIHWYNGPVADEIKAQLPWLLEGDERW